MFIQHKQMAAIYAHPILEPAQLLLHMPRMAPFRTPSGLVSCDSDDEDYIPCPVPSLLSLSPPPPCVPFQPAPQTSAEAMSSMLCLISICDFSFYETMPFCCQRHFHMEKKQLSWYLNLNSILHDVRHTSRIS
jgi:hypothetical protein